MYSIKQFLTVYQRLSASDIVSLESVNVSPTKSRGTVCKFENPPPSCSFRLQRQLSFLDTFGTLIQVSKYVTSTSNIRSFSDPCIYCFTPPTPPLAHLRFPTRFSQITPCDGLAHGNCSVEHIAFNGLVFPGLSLYGTEWNKESLVLAETQRLPGPTA